MIALCDGVTKRLKRQLLVCDVFSEGNVLYATARVHTHLRWRYWNGKEYQGLDAID